MDMRRDLQISASIYGLGAGIFFLGYFLFEIPGNYLLTRIGARLWLSVCMIAWGVISASMSCVTNGTELLCGRFVLGVAEAGFYPGILFFLMQAFPRHWHGRVISYLIVVIPVSSALSAFMSGLIFHLHGVLGLHGWQWLFVLEGLPSILLGFVLYGYLPNRIEEASWLTQAEREYLALRHQESGLRSSSKSFRVFASVAADGTVWRLAAIFFCISFVNGTIHFWLPQIVSSVGYGRQTVMRLVTVPYILGALALIVCAARSDRTGNPRTALFVAMIASCMGLFMTAWGGNVMWQGLFMTIAIACLFIVLGLLWVIPGDRLRGTKVAGGVALINSVGNLGNFFGPTIFSFTLEKSGHYQIGLLMDAIIVFLAAVMFMAVTAVATQRGDV